MIYFIQAPELRLVKIGIAVDVDNRLKGMQVGCPVDLEILFIEPGDHVKERILHKRFSAHRRRGEWFELHSDILQYVNGGWKTLVLEWIDEMPVLYGKTCGPRFGKRMQDCHLTCRCPCCGVECHHGFRPGVDVDPVHRTSHCRCHRPRGYFVAADPDLSVHEFDPRIRLA